MRLRNWAVLTTAGGALVGAVAGACVPVADPEERFLAVGSVCVCGGIIGLFFVFGIPYLVVLARDIRRLQVPPDQLLEGEVVLAATPFSVVHHQDGRPRRFLGQRGGKLFLTNRRLLFQTHWGQPSSYLLDMPVPEISRMTFARVSLAVPNGLHVELDDGRLELFNFGVIWPTEPWVGAIRAFRRAVAAEEPDSNGGPDDVMAGDGVQSRDTGILLLRAAAFSHLRGYHGVVGPVELLMVFLLEPRYRPLGVEVLSPVEVLQTIAEIAPPLVFGAKDTDRRLPSVDEKLILHEAMELKAETGPLEPKHVWASLLRHDCDTVSDILRNLGLDRKRLLHKTSGGVQ